MCGVMERTGFCITRSRGVRWGDEQAIVADPSLLVAEPILSDAPKMFKGFNRLDSVFIGLIFLAEEKAGGRDTNYTKGDGEVFFFQAEDGIRDLTVTGVQTCALPI